MSTKVNVLREELLAALIFASQDDSRYVLNSVAIESRCGKFPLLISTDGRRLCVIESTAPQNESGDLSSVPDLDVVISRDGIKLACSVLKSKLFPVTIDAHLPKRVVFSNPGIALDMENGGIVEGNFPKWRQVVPFGPSEPVTTLGVNSEFVGDFAKAAKLLKPRHVPCISVRLYSGEKAMDVRIDGIENFYAALMPARINATEYQPCFIGMEEKQAA